MGLCRSTGCKITSCQSWRFDKKSCPRPMSNHTSAARVRFLDDRIILQLWQLVTLQPVDPQRPTVLLWKDLNHLKIEIFNIMDQLGFNHRFCILKLTSFTWGLFSKGAISIFRNCICHVILKRFYTIVKNIFHCSFVYFSN